MCRLHMVWSLLLCMAFGGGGYKNINTVFVSARCTYNEHTAIYNIWNTQPRAVLRSPKPEATSSQYTETQGTLLQFISFSTCAALVLLLSSLFPLRCWLLAASIQMAIIFALMRLPSAVLSNNMAHYGIPQPTPPDHATPGNIYTFSRAGCAHCTKANMHTEGRSIVVAPRKTLSIGELEPSLHTQLTGTMCSQVHSKQRQYTRNNVNVISITPTFLVWMVFVIYICGWPINPSVAPSQAPRTRRQLDETML